MSLILPSVISMTLYSGYLASWHVAWFLTKLFICFATSSFGILYTRGADASLQRKRKATQLLISPEPFSAKFPT